MNWDEGGGFMNDSITEEPQALTSSVSVGGDDKNKALAAVSVSQICKLTRPNEGLVLYNKKVYLCNLVALVYEILDVNPQKIHLLVDDYTSGGPLEVTYVMGDTGAPVDLKSFNTMQGESEQRSLESIQVGDYICCVGLVKFNQDRSNFIAYNMRIVEDPNEVTMHNLEVIRDSIYYERLTSGAPMPVVNANNDTKPTMNNNNQQQNTKKDDFGKLSTRDKHLLRYLRERNNEVGMTLDDIANNFKAFSKSDIKESLAILSSEGLAWQGDHEDLWCVNGMD